MAAIREARRVATPAIGTSNALYDKLAPGPGKPASEVAAHQCARIHGAMVEIVVDRGYGAVKVRELVDLAGVSSRAFYEHFDSKEDCFLRTHELIVRRATRRIIASQASERDWRQRPRLIFDSFANELKREPRAARFALVEAYSAGPVALEQARRVERTLESMIGESFSRAPGGVAVPPLVVEGIVAGVVRVARGRLCAGHEAELPSLGGELMDWVLSYPGTSAARLGELDHESVWRNTALEPLAIGPRSGEGEAWPSTGDRAHILSAVAELGAANGFGDLTVSRIRVHAGVSRRTFEAYFTGVEDCFLAALEHRADEALTQAARAQTAGRTWPGGIYRAIAALCDRIAADPLLARACLVDDFASGSRGSRYRQRLISAVAEQLGDSVPRGQRPGVLATEASAGAVWALFHHHVVRDWARQRQQVAATLSFMALAPVIGASAAVAAIHREQTA